MMGSGGTPNSVIKSKRKFDAAQALADPAHVDGAGSFDRGGAPAVLGPDLDFETISFSPADLMLLDVQTFDAQVIAAVYGVPAQMVNLPLEGGLNYQTPVLMLEQWWRTELRTTAKRVTTALNSNMLPAGQYVESDAREFLAPAFKDHVESWDGGRRCRRGDARRGSALRFCKLRPPRRWKTLDSPPSAGASPRSSLRRSSNSDRQAWQARTDHQGRE